MRITANVPATTANLGPGFDAVGLALGLWNSFTVEPVDGDFEVSIRGRRAPSIMLDGTNLVFRAMRRVFDLSGRTMPSFRLELENNVPCGKGLGSSATAIVGGLALANHLLGGPLRPYDLVQLATEIEGHPDNVAPAVLGGIVVAVPSSKGELDILELPCPRGLDVVVAVPDFELSTSTSRNVLPSQVSFADAVFNSSRAALLVGALAVGDWKYLRTAMEDRLHQPYRQGLIPGLSQVFESALAGGAAGVALSGAGPSVAAFVEEGRGADIGARMQEALNCAGVSAEILIVGPTTAGVAILEEGVSV